MTRRLTWKRPKAGVYVSGEFRIEGSGTHWMLYRDTEEQTYCIGTGRSKKELQDLAEDPPKRREPKPKTQPKPVDDLGSVIASFRLEVARLTDTIGLLAAAIFKLEEKL